MTTPQPFPNIDTAALDTCAADLNLVGTGMSDTGTNISVLANAVAGSEQWQGEAASRWHAVVTGRAADATLTSTVMAKAGSLLGQLAADVAAERQQYNRLATQMTDQGAAYNPRFNPGPPNWEAPYVAAMTAAARRAAALLTQAGNDFLALAALAADITATTAAGRLPGVPAGTNRRQASLTLLATLFGSVVSNRVTGSAFETQVLQELGLDKNTDIWRPGTPFEGRTTLGGLAKGTIPDAQGPGSIVEIKDVSNLSARFQIRLEELNAQLTGRELWIVVRGGAKVSDDVTLRAERTGGGVLYRTGPSSYTDPQGNPVRIDPGMKVSGYQRVTDPPPAPDPGAPSAPVDPAPAPEPVEPVTPIEPVEPIEPIEIP